MITRRRGSTLYPLEMRRKQNLIYRRKFRLGLLTGLLLGTAGSVGLWYVHSPERPWLIDLLSPASAVSQDICINNYAYKIKPDGRLAAIGFIRDEDKSSPYPVMVRWRQCDNTPAASLP